MIFALFAQLFSLFFYWKGPIERQYTDHSAIAWEMFAADFQAELTTIQSLEVHQNGDGIHFRTDRGLIAIEQRNHVIRKSIDGLGHVPFLTNISSVQFSLHHPLLVVYVTMQDGTRKERDFIIGDYSR
ncbi:hypothetical protein BI350_10065 [Sporosarcina ureilytica]|uniref:Competence protein ComGF n=2 Tax=Sporosarcina ureilytica TaxID=298596 RepID=A0A1D8JGN6_9BACL|nr:hypothetical protein BI350_10065 [Sporosarcina ureilytica]